jgi:hypothetical protein
MTTSAAKVGIVKRIWAFVRDDKNSQLIILACSSAVGLIWFLLKKPGYSCDTQSYLTWLAGALGQPIPTIYQTIRAGGYPLLLAAFQLLGPIGSPIQVYSVLIFQIATAVAIPVLIFRTLEPYNHRIAFVTSILSIVSLTPYIDSELILPNQIYKFLLVALAYLACRFLTSSSPRRWLVPLYLVNAFLCILYPLSAFLFPIVLLFLIVARPRQWLAISASAFIVVAVVVSYNFYVSMLLVPKGLWTPPAGETLDGDAERLDSRLLDLAFHDLYIVNNAADLSGDRGAARHSLRDVLEHFPVDFPNHWRPRTPVRMFAAFEGRPSAWVNNLNQEPNGIYFTAIKDAVGLTAHQGSSEELKNEARGLIRRVVSEVYQEHPSLIVSFLFRYGVAPSLGATAERVFYRVFYIKRAGKISYSNGPASREYISFIRRYLADNPDAWAQLAKKHLPADDRKNMDALISEVALPARDDAIFQYGWSGMDQYLGHYKSSSTHASVLRETFTSGEASKQQLSYWELASTLGSDLRAFYFGSFSELSDGEGAVQCLLGMPWENAAPKRQADAPRTRLGFDRASWSLFHVACSLLVFVLLVPCFFSPLRLPVAFLGSVLVWQGVSSSIYSRAQVGDIDQVMPLAVLLAGMMACALPGKYSARFEDSGRRIAAFLNTTGRKVLAAYLKDRRGFAAVYVALFLILLVGIEMFARWFLPERSIYGATQPGEYSRYHPYLAVTNESSLDRDGLWWDPNHSRSIPYHIKTNRLGFRMDREIDTTTKYQKMPNEKVVLIFGSSTVYGFGSTSNETTLAGWLQQLLNAQQSRTHYTVFNMGNGWWIAYQELAALQLYGLMLDPDWLIFMDGRNDIFNIGYTFGEELGIHGSATATRDLVDGYLYQKLRPEFYRGSIENELIRHSAAYRYITGKQYIPRNQPLVQKERGWKDVDENIDPYLRFQRLTLLQCPTCQYILSTQPINRSTLTMTPEERKQFVANNKELRIGGDVINTPNWENIIHYSFGRLRDEMPEICAAAGPRCRYKFMDEIFPAKYSEKSNYFVDDVHLTVDGNKFIADYYASLILKVEEDRSNHPGRRK